jgi:putative hemolysin
MPGDPFSLDDLPLTPLSRAAYHAARPLLERALGLDTLRGAYRAAQDLQTGSFARRALQVLNVDVEVSDTDLAHLPASGPLIVVANHPHGALDGLVLAAGLERARPDLRLLANMLLRRLPQMRDLCFFVDPFGGKSAPGRSRAGLRAAHGWLRRGHALLVFPAGEVAHETRDEGTPNDSPWLDTVGRLAIASGAAVVPAFIAGRNSASFYLAGRVHPLLRTMLLGRELVRRRGRTIPVVVGRPLDLSVSRPTSAASIVAAARSAADGLARHGTDQPTEPSRHATTTARAIAREIDRLPPHACFGESNGFRVCCAEARQIPRTLDEIGRLRELTYRAVGEGTGCDRDLDQFDQYYTHLFLWDIRTRRVAGAYRIGNVDDIVRRQGVGGLYTRQLFRYDAGFVDRMGPALELGRSWIHADYQKNYNALLMLWRGIGRYVVERSAARVLFGPVSISARYSDASHALLVAFLAQNHLERPLAEMVEALHPTTLPAPTGVAPVLPRSIAEADALVSRMEADGKGVPVLLRQYLKLNARVIGFNVDPNFGDALDALMMVDLTTVSDSVLVRYLGKETAAAFLAKHRTAVDRRQAA